jgi:hypothetical protein
LIRGNGELLEVLIDSPVRLPPICNSAIKKDERMADACAGTTRGEIGKDRVIN